VDEMDNKGIMLGGKQEMCISFIKKKSMRTFGKFIVGETIILKWIREKCILS
jgi:hypothetical protein